MRVKASRCVCVCSGWVEHKGSGRDGGGGSLTVFVCARGKVGVTPHLLPEHTPTPGRLRPETLIMLPKKRDRLEHPSARQGPHTNAAAHTHTHKSSRATKSTPRWRRSKVRPVRQRQWKLIGMADKTPAGRNVYLFERLTPSVTLRCFSLVQIKPHSGRFFH